MPAAARLLLPRPALAGCLFAGLWRDTRGAALDDAQRLSHFPASPLIGVTWVLAGEIRLLAPGGFARRHSVPPLPRVSVAGPQNHPTTSWTPGPVLALSLGVYPDAWARLTGGLPLPAADQPPVAAPDLLARLTDDAALDWDRLQDAVSALWHEAEGAPHARLGDWARSLAARAALSGPGTSLRSMERRIRRWTGQTRGALSLFAGVDDLHARVSRATPASLAELAAEAGYADQSHMGRAVRRVTGYSPARLNRLIAEDEAFWPYRLLGERF
jgi:AraC-like DNA-binding protein